MKLHQLRKMLRKYPRNATVLVNSGLPRITLTMDQDNQWIVHFNNDAVKNVPTNSKMSNAEK